MCDALYRERQDGSCNPSTGNPAMMRSDERTGLRAARRFIFATGVRHGHGGEIRGRVVFLRTEISSLRSGNRETVGGRYRKTFSLITVDIA